MSSKTLCWAILALLIAAGAYGFLHERLWAQELWSAAGAARFLGYAGVFWSVAGLILWQRPGWIRWLAPAAALLYAAWWAGPMAPLAVLYFLGSCYLLGRRLARETNAWSATLLGAAVWMLLIWIALHFPVNTRWIYAAAFGLPYVFFHRSLTVAAWKPGVLPRREAAALSVLLFLLIAHLLAALKPEVSADGLSMHLALPVAVAREARWAFDFRLYSWALMPNGADSLYAAVYLLGGEHAAHLLNFSFLALTCVLLARAARRWVSPAEAWLIAALFASTPLALLLTGSLYVENAWTAMVLAATLALVEYLEQGAGANLALIGTFLGAALAMKLIAAAFAAPVLAVAAVSVLRKGSWRPALAAAALFGLFAAPPYTYAYARSGNPIFPFANAVFRSPDFDSSKSFADPRYAAPFTWKTPYEVTFRSARFLESQNGASGFQYFLLLIPALLLARRKEQWAILAAAGLAAGIVLAVRPNLRFVYPALPLASLAIGWLVAQAPPAMRVPGLLALIGLNTWFLPSSGFYDKDFALFRHSEIRPYVERLAPARLLAEDLNRRAPGAPAAFFSADQAGGLNAPAYTDSWHSGRYWDQIQNAQDAQSIAAILNRLGVHYVVAPVSRRASLAPVDLFLRLWLDPLGEPAGALGLFQIRAVPSEASRSTFAPGRYDDGDERIEYSGSWYHDPQFSEPYHHSLTYSQAPGASFRIAFTGSAITYVFTAAANRGIAEVSLDGRPQARIDQYSLQTGWQSSRRMGGISPGSHTLEVRVSGQKNPGSAGAFVDLDGFLVEP